MIPNCVACSVAMEGGYLPDHGHGSTTHVGVWVQGEPKPTLFGNPDIDAAPKYQINAYRCPKCGVIQLYGTRCVY